MIDEKLKEFMERMKEAELQLQQKEREPLQTEKVRVYHGTSFQRFLSIQNNGLNPTTEEFAFVTTEKETARLYAWSATGRAIFNREQPDELGVIIEFVVNGNDLELDNFNLNEELFQYKTKGISKDKIVNYEVISFDEFSRENKDNARNIAEAVVFFGQYEKNQD